MIDELAPSVDHRRHISVVEDVLWSLGRYEITDDPGTGPVSPGRRRHAIGVGRRGQAEQIDSDSPQSGWAELLPLPSMERNPDRRLRLSRTSSRGVNLGSLSGSFP